MSPESSPPLPRKWVLVVDDDARLRAVWTDALAVAGYAVVGSEDGKAALELIRDLFPDLILLDLRMPRMTGQDFLDTVGEHPRWRSIPILIVSGYLGDDAEVRAAGVNVVGRMEKPLPLDKLVQQVRAVVGPGSAAGKNPPQSAT